MTEHFHAHTLVLAILTVFPRPRLESLAWSDGILHTDDSGKL